MIPGWDPQDMAELHVGSPGKRTKMLPRDGREGKGKGKGWKAGKKNSHGINTRTLVSFIPVPSRHLQSTPNH